MSRLFASGGQSIGISASTSVLSMPHLGLCPGPNIPLQGRQRSRGCKKMEIGNILVHKKLFYGVNLSVLLGREVVDEVRLF